MLCEYILILKRDRPLMRWLHFLLHFGIDISSSVAYENILSSYIFATILLYS
jgi:hypothetical protein